MGAKQHSAWSDAFPLQLVSALPVTRIGQLVSKPVGIMRLHQKGVSTTQQWLAVPAVVAVPRSFAHHTLPAHPITRTLRDVAVWVYSCMNAQEATKTALHLSTALLGHHLLHAPLPDGFQLWIITLWHAIAELNVPTVHYGAMHLTMVSP